MIKINLLPPEKRKAERTPLPRFFLIVMNAAALVLFAAGIAYYALIKIPDIENQTKEAITRRQSLQKDVDEHDRLFKELTALNQKVTQIDQLTNRGVEWWRAVNAVWDVITENEKVWIDEIRMLDGRAAAGDLKKGDAASTATPPFGLSLRCHTAGEEVETMTRFRTSLKEHPVLKEVLPGLNMNVDWQKTDEKDTAEKFSLTFSVTLVGGPPVAKPAPTAPPRGN